MFAIKNWKFKFLLGDRKICYPTMSSMFEPMKFKIHEIMDNVNAKLKFRKMSFYQGKSEGNTWDDVELKFVYYNNNIR